LEALKPLNTEFQAVSYFKLQSLNEFVPRNDSDLWNCGVNKSSDESTVRTFKDCICHQGSFHLSYGFIVSHNHERQGRRAWNCPADEKEMEGW